jgi:hypothetical protein
MIEYEAATVESPLQCTGKYITLERAARILAGIYTAPNYSLQYSKQYRFRTVRKSFPVDHQGIDGTMVQNYVS